jgi:M6 family metalloprotease-like protein
MKPTFWLSVLIALLLAASVSMVAQAAPAAPIDITLTQPDGSSFQARMWGDEWQNGYETLTGYTILQTRDGWWVYAGAVENGSLVPALNGSEPMIVGQVAPDGLTPRLRPAAVNEPLILSNAGSLSDIQSGNSGSQPVLVLLASFTDRNGTYTAANFASSMFGASNSVKDYYSDASFGLLTLTPAAETHGTANDGVVGWLNLEYAHPNTGSSVDDRNKTIVKTALTKADPYVNFAAFDTNGDGYISNTELHIIVVVAGFERAFSGTSPSVWGHRSAFNLTVTPPVLDGKILGDFDHSGGYAQFGEIHLDHQATIGIMAHEMGHDLTWPDLYDTDDSSEGVGNWSLMGSGNWTGITQPGDSPSLPDAFLKWYQGWITPTTVNGTLTGASIQQAETNAKAYLLRPNPNGVDWNFRVTSGSGEYFLVENRQQTGYDAALPGCGLLIWHIDESVTYTNSANANENHPLVQLLQADGLRNLEIKTNRGDTGDPYPGSTNNRTLNFSSNPNSRLYSGIESYVSVANVSAGCSTTMTADLTYLELSFKVFLATLFEGGTPPVVTDPIRNGTFEAGQDGNWTEFSTHGWDLLSTSFPGTVTPHGGTWAVWMGGDYDDTSQLTQTGISLTGVRYLHFWYWIGSGDVCGYDYARVKVNSTPIKTYDLCTTTNTGGWVQEILDLNSYVGTSITLQFEVIADSSNKSNFFLDDVSITSSATPAPPQRSDLKGDEASPR